MLHLEHSFVWCWSLDTSEDRSEVPWKFWNVVPEKNGDQLDRSCEKWVLRRVKEERNVLYTIKKGRLVGLVTSCVGTSF
jgi:hypothetical protein